MVGFLIPTILKYSRGELKLSFREVKVTSSGFRFFSVGSEPLIAGDHHGARPRGVMIGIISSGIDYPPSPRPPSASAALAAEAEGGRGEGDTVLVRTHREFHGDEPRGDSTYCAEKTVMRLAGDFEAMPMSSGSL